MKNVLSGNELHKSRENLQRLETAKRYRIQLRILLCDCLIQHRHRCTQNQHKLLKLIIRVIRRSSGFHLTLVHQRGSARKVKGELLRRLMIYVTTAQKQYPEDRDECGCTTLHASNPRSA